MRKIYREISRIDWKNGSGSIIIGTTILLVAFTAAVVIMDMFNLFYTQTKTQTITDAVTDGAAVAGNVPGGFDEDRMGEAAQMLVLSNQAGNANLNYSISAADEVDEKGNLTGNKLVYATIEADQSYFVPTYLGYGERFQVSADAVVRVEPVTDDNGWITVSFATNPSLRPPFTVTSTGHRNGAYVSWFIKYYLNPEYNQLYDHIESGHTGGYLFLYDYLVCMGFDRTTLSAGTPAEFARYFKGSPSGWKFSSDRAEIQKAANEGKPVVIIQEEKGGGNIELSVAVQSLGVLEDNEIATAHAGSENWNYKRVNFDSLYDGFDTIIAIHE